MTRILTIAAVFAILYPATVLAEDDDPGVAGRDAPSNFDRTHDAIDRTMNTGNDRAPLGSQPGERSGLGGAPGGGNDPNGANGGAINTR